MKTIEQLQEENATLAVVCMKRCDMVSECNATACEDQVVPVEDSSGKWVRYEDAAALAAQVDILRKALEYADNKLYILTHNREDVSQRLIGDADKAFKIVRDTMNQTANPKVHLREVRAEAGRAGFVAGALEWGDIGFSCLVEDSANQYAEQIRRGEVE